MIVWGGRNNTGFTQLNTGGRYNRNQHLARDERDQRLLRGALMPQCGRAVR